MTFIVNVDDAVDRLGKAVEGYKIRQRMFLEKVIPEGRCFRVCCEEYCELYVICINSTKERLRYNRREEAINVYRRLYGEDKLFEILL